MPENAVRWAGLVAESREACLDASHRLAGRGGWRGQVFWSSQRLGRGRKVLRCLGDDRGRRGAILEEDATDVRDGPHAGQSFGQPLKLDVYLAVFRRGRDQPADLGLRVLGDRHVHLLERKERTRAHLRHRVVEGPVGDAVNRVFDPGATGHPDGRQRGDRAALEHQASKQNRHHWRAESARQGSQIRNKCHVFSPTSKRTVPNEQAANGSAAAAIPNFLIWRPSSRDTLVIGLLRDLRQLLLASVAEAEVRDGDAECRPLRLEFGHLKRASALGPFEGAPLPMPARGAHVALEFREGNGEILNVADEDTVLAEVALNLVGLIGQHGFALDLILDHGDKDLELRAGPLLSITGAMPFALKLDGLCRLRAEKEYC